MKKSRLINSTRQKDARTYNEAVTHSTSLNNIVDLFFISGASRTMSVDSIKSMLDRAYSINKLLTLKVIFWAGNIRGGQGERRFLRIALKWLEDADRSNLLENLENVPHYNRWDSLFHLESPEVLTLVGEALLNDKNGLCAKWMPRKKQYGNFAHDFRTSFGLNHKEYRELIVGLSNTVEQLMCNKLWDKIEYSTVPSKAMNKYRKAFGRNDTTRFNLFIERVEKGEDEIKAGAIYPYDLYVAYERNEDRAAINAQWNALPNYLEGDNSILPVCDVSGSMFGQPITISVSLGVYLSERNKGIFKDAFMTFSGEPTMEYLQGDACSRFSQLRRAPWGMNTNLNAVFHRILEKAVDNNIPESDMPRMLLIISDMEFDECGSLTNYERVVEIYEEHGYKLPRIVFWNVNGRAGNVPVSSKIKNVGLVSGASPSIMKSILSGKDFSPEGIMLETLNDKVYDRIKVANSN